MKAKSILSIAILALAANVALAADFAGTVVSSKPIEVAGPSTAVADAAPGAVLGGILGAVLGHQAHGGSDSTKSAATGLGALVGAIGGGFVSTKLADHTANGREIVVQRADGSTITVRQPAAATAADEVVVGQVVLVRDNSDNGGTTHVVGAGSK